MFSWALPIHFSAFQAPLL